MNNPAPTYAVIDLGTNTFHLIIAKGTGPTNYKVVFRKRRFVKLANAGVGLIPQDALDRGLQAMEYFVGVMKQYGVNHYRALGTAALRNASNGSAFVAIVKQRTGLNIELISGDEEASWILKGVQAIIPSTTHPQLIVDIGGGSVECMLNVANQLVFAQSFPVGVAILNHRFHHRNPIHEEEMQNLNQFLTQQLNPLLQILKQYAVKQLVGAAGTFDVIARQKKPKGLISHPVTIPVKTFLNFANSIIPLTTEERKMDIRIPPQRVDMIVVALLLVKFFLHSAPIKEITVSPYAMKEGILFDLMASQRF